MKKERFYKYAENASTKSNFYKCHTGCVAVYAGHVIAEGSNSNKTHTLQNKYNKYRNFDANKYPSSLHAEMMVINKIKYLNIDFSKVTLFVWRGHNKPRLSKPCASCEKAIKDLGIKKVFYTGNDSFIYEKYN